MSFFKLDQSLYSVWVSAFSFLPYSDSLQSCANGKKLLKSSRLPLHSMSASYLCSNSPISLHLDKSKENNKDLAPATRFIWKKQMGCWSCRCWADGFKPSLICMPRLKMHAKT